jgi:hypothetical protein
LAPFPALVWFPPSQEDKEHAPNGNNNPEDPEEKTPPYPGHILEPNEWNDKIQEKEKEEPSDPRPKAFSHHFTSSVMKRITHLLKNHFLLKHSWGVSQENRRLPLKQGHWRFIIDYFPLTIYNIIYLYLVKHRNGLQTSLVLQKRALERKCLFRNLQ